MCTSPKWIKYQIFLSEGKVVLGEILRKDNSHKFISICVSRINLNQYFLFQFAENIQFSNIIWLLFLESCYVPEKFFADVNIPFDCEFIVVQQMDGHTMLTELYRVSPTYPLQTYLFGNWTAERGLSVPIAGFYKRRNNLQGLVMKTGTVQVHIFLCNWHL